MHIFHQSTSLLVLTSLTHGGMEGWVNPQPWNSRASSEQVLIWGPYASQSSALPTELSWPASLHDMVCICILCLHLSVFYSHITGYHILYSCFLLNYKLFLHNVLSHNVHWTPLFFINMTWYLILMNLSLQLPVSCKFCNKSCI